MMMMLVMMMMMMTVDDADDYLVNGDDHDDGVDGDATDGYFDDSGKNKHVVMTPNNNV